MRLKRKLWLEINVAIRLFIKLFISNKFFIILFSSFQFLRKDNNTGISTNIHWELLNVRPIYVK